MSGRGPRQRQPGLAVRVARVALTTAHGAHVIRHGRVAQADQAAQARVARVAQVIRVEVVVRIEVVADGRH